MFVSESLVPDREGFDAGGMAQGGPGLPRSFWWKKRHLVVQRVLSQWTETAPCRNGSGERYRDRHWYECVTAEEERIKLYFERRMPRNGKRLLRWWLFSIEGKTSEGAL